MILGDTVIVEFQCNELLDLSLNTRLALGITEMETHPRGRVPGQWSVCQGRAGPGEETGLDWTGRDSRKDSPRVSWRKGRCWHIKLLACESGTS